jgi:hypothetical protein
MKKPSQKTKEHDKQERNKQSHIDGICQNLSIENITG